VHLGRLVGQSVGFLLFLCLANVVLADSKPLRRAVFIPQWVPQAQFAGYFMAKERGIYAKYRIDLTILNGGPGRDPHYLLSNRAADFASMWLSSAIKERALGSDIINISQLFQNSGLMLVAKKSSGIEMPQDLNGKKVGLWGNIFRVQLQAFFEKYNLQVTEVPQSYSVNLFLRGGVDVASAMWYNEYHTILMSGINQDELTTFLFQKYGLNFPEDGIYTTGKLYNKDPYLCRDFVKASLEGWRVAFKNPEAALNIVIKNLREAHIPASRAHQKWMLNRIEDLMLPKDSSRIIGHLLPEDYFRVAKALRRSKLIEKPPDYDDFYRQCIAYDEK
jgi:NitT/TauT family transport system substrate-binding protein